jgi:hypothetical protein
MSDRKEIVAALNKLRSSYIGERMEAEEQFRGMGPEGVEGLLRLLAGEAGKRRSRRRIYFVLLGFFMLVGVPVALWMTYLALSAGDSKTTGAYLGAALGGILGGGGGGVLGGFSFLLFPTQTQMMAGDAVALMDDKRVAGHLTEALASGIAFSYQSRVAIARALIRLLPRLEPENRELFTSQQRTALYRVLRKGNVDKEAELLVAVMKAVGNIGDASAITLLDDLAKRPANTAKECRVAEVAAMVATRLRERLERERTGEILLRSAGSPLGPSEVLGRPVMGSQEADPATLLRATQSNTDS